MSLALETRLALLGLPPHAITPDLRSIMADWAARCEAMSAHARADIDPFTLPVPATLSPLGAPRRVDWAEFTLGQDMLGQDVRKGA